MWTGQLLMTCTSGKFVHVVSRGYSREAADAHVHTRVCVCVGLFVCLGQSLPAPTSSCVFVFNTRPPSPPIQVGLRSPTGSLESSVLSLGSYLKSRLFNE